MKECHHTKIEHLNFEKNQLETQENQPYQKNTRKSMVHRILHIEILSANY